MKINKHIFLGFKIKKIIKLLHKRNEPYFSREAKLLNKKIPKNHILCNQKTIFLLVLLVSFFMESPFIYSTKTGFLKLALPCKTQILQHFRPKLLRATVDGLKSCLWNCSLVISTLNKKILELILEWLESQWMYDEVCSHQFILNSVYKATILTKCNFFQFWDLLIRTY